MASIKNKYEFYKGFLEALGAQDVAETEYKNEEELRKKILDTMGVEYVFDDVNQTDLFRGKFLEGLANGGGGGTSDFSTAKVTLQPVAGESFLGASATAIIGYFLSEENSYSCSDFRMLASVESEILLYDGEAILTINTVFDESSQPAISPHFAVVSGDAVQDEQYDDTFYISGDCVISVSTK